MERDPGKSPVTSSYAAPASGAADGTGVPGGRPSRRQVLRGAGAGLGAAALAPVLGTGVSARPVGGAASLPAAVPDLSGRQVNFDQAWKFVLVNADGITDPAGAYADAMDPGFDDSNWQTVDIPHDWSIELTPVNSASVESFNGFLPGGLAWYRKTFTLPSSLSGKRISIEFDGVYMNSDVYLNGQLLGNHPYAYTGFGYDLTGKLHTDGVTPNVIAVKAENQIPSSRWYSGSGIYRDVYLVVTGPVHIARHGTFVTTPSLETTITSGYAGVQVQTDVENDGGAAASVTVAITVRDARGAVVAQGTSDVSVAAGQTQSDTSNVRVDNPALWSTDNPSLYQLETELLVGGTGVDSTTTTFGIRYFNFDPSGGFRLNGQYLKLQGVDLHATQGPLGAAIHKDSLTRQFQLMKSMGTNVVRTAHNPPAPALVAVAEELGIMLMVEAFDCWHTGKVAYDYHLYFDAWGDSDIKEMVNAHKNSPAVVLWSIGNETPDTGLPDGPPIARRLVADIKSIDTTRPVVMGSDKYRSVPSAGSPQDQIVQLLDGLGVNYNTAKSMDGLHAKYPGKFFFCSETSSETSTRGVYQDPQLINTGENYTPGKRSTSSYDNNLASWCMSGEYELKKDRDRKFWAGGFLWAGQDYIGEPTPYDVFPVKSSFFGAFDTAGFEKDAHYLYKSQWSAAPMVHIVPMKWTDYEPGQTVAVWVYANVATVELLLNGTSLGTKSFDRKVTAFGKPYLETTEPTGDDYNYPSGSYTSPNGSMGKLHLTWDVPFQPGRLIAVATEDGQQVSRDELDTTGMPRAIALTPDKRVITADGSALSHVTVEVVDAHGRVIPGAGNLIQFSVEGQGKLVGTDNGHQENATGYTSPSMPVFNGKALAVVASTRQPGAIKLTATSPGLPPSWTTLVSVADSSAGPAVAGIGAAAGVAVPVGVQAAASGGSQATPTADASYSGSPTTIPAAMLDGSLTTGWSNYYVKVATANVKAVSVSNATDWVSLSWQAPQTFGAIKASFTTGTPLALPASIAVTYWDGHELVPVKNPKIDWATASNQPTTVTFDPVTSTEVRLTMTSPSPGTSAGFLQIAELQAVMS
jgi:beta-galactosidase